MAEHVLPQKLYVLVFAALIAFTALTTWVAYIDLGVLNTVVALVIAVSKATLVVLFFMHLKYQAGMTRVVLLAAVLWLAILIVLTLSDVFTRNWSPTAQPWQQSVSLPQGSVLHLESGIVVARPSFAEFTLSPLSPRRPLRAVRSGKANGLRTGSWPWPARAGSP